MFAILLSISLKSAAILAVAWLGTFLLRGRSAAARRLVWTAAAAAILALPALTLALPSWRVPAPRAIAPGNVGLMFRAFATAAADPAPADSATAAPAAPRASAAIPWQPDWRKWTIALWTLGCSLVLLQMLVAWLRLLRLRATAPPLAGDSDLRDLAASFDIAGDVALLQGPAASMPMAVGVLRPAIFLPADSIHWTGDRRRMVLLHELAHVRSGDVAAHLLARLALALNWWNPLAWSAWRAFLKECERAADDLVLAAGARPSDYAGHLLEVARSLQSRAGYASAALAMARKAQLEGRLLAILDSHTPRGAAGRLTPVLAAIAAVALVAPFAALRAQDQSAAGVPPELDATIRAANSQKNHEILEHAAAAYEKLRQYDVAQTLLEDALAIRGEVSGAQSAAYAAGLVKLGDLELKRNQRADALAFYRKAVALGDRPEVAGALIQLGISVMGPRGRTPATDTGAAVARTLTQAVTGEAPEDYFQRAIAVDPTGPKAGEAYTWMAELKRYQSGGAAEAESFYQKALSVEDPRSAEAGNTMHLYARFLEQQNRDDEAAVMAKQARDVTQAAATQYARQTGGTVLRAGSGRGSASSGVVFDDAAPGDTALRVGAGVSAPQLISKTEPEYTEQARAAKYQGSVLLYIEVGPDGAAHNMKVIRSLGLGLDEKAIDAVSQWKFKPGMKNGQPVTVQATIEVNFRLL